MVSFAAAAFIGLCLLGDAAVGYRHSVEQKGAGVRAGGESGAQQGAALGAEEALDSAVAADSHGTAGCGQGAAEETIKQYMDLRSKNYATNIGKLLTEGATYVSPQEGTHGPSRDAVVDQLAKSVVAGDTYRNILFECVVVVNFEATGKVTYEYKRPRAVSWLSSFADMSTKFKLKCSNSKWFIEHILVTKEGGAAAGCSEANAVRTLLQYNELREKNSVQEIRDLLAEKVHYTAPGSGKLGHLKNDVLEYLANSPVEPDVHRNRTVQCAIAVGEEATGKITYEFQKPRYQNWLGSFTAMTESIAMVCSGHMWLIDYVAVAE